MLWGVSPAPVYEFRLPCSPVLIWCSTPTPCRSCSWLSPAVLWLVTTVYAIGYLEDMRPNRSRFFGFFSLCVSATTGIALAGNLVTFLMFYEMLTLSTYPLVVHRGTPESMRAGRIYLIYTLAGGARLLARGGLARVPGRPARVRRGRILWPASPDSTPSSSSIIFALLIAGLGVKAALVPLHGWLPQAMVAPAPVSALLHAVAVVKAGAFGIVRVVYDVYGIDALPRTGGSAAARRGRPRSPSSTARCARCSRTTSSDDWLTPP